MADDGAARKPPKVYCDTDTLWHNVERHADDEPKAKEELTSLRAIAGQANGRPLLHGSLEGSASRTGRNRPAGAS
jgi:hypothetical protein